MKEKQFIIIVVLCIFLSENIVAQVDTNEAVNHSSELKGELKEKQHYLDVNFMEENRLLKLGISPANRIIMNENYTNGSVGLIASYEKKITPSISYIVEASAKYGHVSSSNYKNDRWTLGGNLGIRYYYSIKKRIRESIGGNNFHSNYFSFGVSGDYVNGYVYIESLSSPIEDTYNWNESSVYIGWGMQRRISTWGFYDFSPYIALPIVESNYVSKADFYIGAKLTFGLAWGK